MRLFIGSANPGKINDWRNYLPTWEILSYQDLELSKIEVEEGITSLEENARKKAQIWAAHSGELTLSDDTGFFIKALGGFPGVSVKRWGGRFEKEMNGRELLRYLKAETENLDDLSCYFESAYAIADPSGRTQVFSERLPGNLDRALLQKEFSEDFRLGVVFKAKGCDRAWREMGVGERKEFDREVVRKIEGLVQNFAD